MATMLVFAIVEGSITAYLGELWHHLEADCHFADWYPLLSCSI